MSPDRGALGARGRWFNDQPDDLFTYIDWCRRGVPHVDWSCRQPSRSQKWSVTCSSEAIRTTGIKRVVNLSSVGADQGPKIGALYVYNIIEGFVGWFASRCYVCSSVAFYGNIMGSIQTIKAQQLPSLTISCFSS